MRRISVVGSPGSGKTTFAKTLAGRLGIAHIELDAIHWRPDWQPTPRDDFLANLRPRLAADAWVVDGNYTNLARDTVWDCADTVIWLDLSKPVVMRSIIARSISRVLSRRQLWNGNRERLRNMFSRDPERNIILWAWTHYDRYRTLYTDAIDDTQWSQVEFVVLRNRRDMTNFLGSVRR